MGTVMGIDIGLVLLLFAAVVIVVVLTRRARKLDVDESLVPTVRSVTRRVRLRNVIALVATLALAAYFLYAPPRYPDPGLVLFSAPVITGCIAIVFFVIVPAFADPAGRRMAELTPRTFFSFATHRAVALAAGFGAAVVVTCVILGLIAQPNGQSFMYDYTTADWRFGGGPFPGFFYSTPVLVAVGVLAAATVFATLRVSSARMPSDETLREADATLRRLAVSVILRTATAAYALTLAGLIAASAAIHSTVNFGIAENAPTDPRLVPLPFFQVLVPVEYALAVLFLLTGLAFATGAVTNALRTPLALRAVAA